MNISLDGRSMYPDLFQDDENGYSKDEVVNLIKRKLNVILKDLSDNSLSKDPPAAVFDIDETLILNQHDRNPGMEDGFTVHPAVQSIYRFLEDQPYFDKIPIFVVTARQKSQASAQYAYNQISHFYGNPNKNGKLVAPLEKLYMTPREHARDVSPALFKFLSRQRVIESGYTIVLNAGDNWSDLGQDELHDDWESKYPATDRHYLLEEAESTSLLSWKVPNRD